MSASNSLINRLAAGVFSLNLFVYALVGLSIYQSRQQYERQVALTTQNLAHSLEISISGILNKIDVALFALSKEAERQLVGGGINGKVLNAYIAQLHGQIPEFEEMWVADEEGNVRFGTNIPASKPINITDREYFGRLYENPHPGLVISQPVIGRITKTWSVLICRRINHPDGSFAGVAFGSLGVVDYFTKMFSVMDIGKHGIIALRDDGLSLIAQFPPSGQIGSKVLSAKTLEMIRANPNSATYTTLHKQDNIERTFSYEKVTRYPFYIFVAQGKSEYLSPWRKEVAIALTLLALFTFVTLFSAWMIDKDITERKRAEEALRKTELKFSKIFHSVPALIGITTQPEGRCVDINETGLRTLGYRREEMVGRTMLELGVWESASIRDRLIRVLEEDGMVRDIEVNFRGKNGKTFTGLLSAEPIDFNGARYVLSVVNDITERKRMEDEIARLNSAVAARAAELESINVELEAFNYTVAHDLRKPLAVVNGYCQLIREMYSDNLDERGKEYLREVYDGTWRMNQLIDTLLDFSRLARCEINHETVDLSAVAQDVAAELRLAEPGRPVNFAITEGVTANGDPGLLRVVLENLLGNAWKYTGMREEALIEFGVTDIDGKPAYFVRDNGLGFAMADAEKLFLPFQRLPGADEFKGHGIGLATVDRIIRRHGGRVWAEGEPGKGACFWFTLSAA